MRRSRRDKSKGLEPIEKILERWMRANRVRQRVDRDSVFGKWKEVVGEAMSERSRVVDCAGGLLTGEVDSAPLLHELSTYYRRELLDKLRRLEGFPNLSDIRFRAGTFDTDG